MTDQPVDPSRFEEYRDGRRRAYVIVGARQQFFPRRELDTIEYSIEDTYQGLYQRVRGYLGKPRRHQPRPPRPDELTYGRYGLWHYVLRGKQDQEPYASLHRAGANLRGLIRVLLFKRFESSVYAFQQTIHRLLRAHEGFLIALDAGIVPAGDEARSILYESDYADETELVTALREASGRYDVADFNVARLREHIEHDIALYEELLRLVIPITPDQDAKLCELQRRLAQPPLNEGKRLVFTQYADTARYLFENLNPGGEHDDIEVVYSGDKSKARIVGRFAPQANPQFRFQAGDSELMTVVATDVLAEGLNLQDCDKIINYDLHWNPVRLIQRFGRIDRIGSEHDVIDAFNFLPETGLDRNLGLRQRLQNRIQEIHDTIGEDVAILDPSERLNEDAMYAIYERQGGRLSGLEDEEEQFLALSEAEEMLRQLQRDSPEEYERIANLRDGIRSAAPSDTPGLFVFCQAGRYQQLFLVDEQGQVVSRDIPRVLGAIRSGPDVEPRALPDGYNAAVMRVQRQFAEEVKHRESERRHTLSLTVGQKYALRELRVLFGATTDDEQREQINRLDQAFRLAPNAAVSRELNRLRRNGVTGAALLQNLTRTYLDHNMREWLDRPGLRLDDQPVPLIVCSEALV